MTCFRVTEFSILPQKEVHRSLQVGTQEDSQARASCSVAGLRQVRIEEVGV